MTGQALRRRKQSDAILASAVAAFREHGYHGTSMRQIADALLRTKGSLYYYFGSKADILFAAHDRALDSMLAVLARVEATAGDPRTQLRELIVEHTRAMVDGFQGTALALELDALSPERRRRLVAKRDRYERGLRAIVERGVRRGLFRAVDARLAGFALLGSINWTARWYRRPGNVPPEELGSVYADLFLRGLCDPEPAFAAPSLHAEGE
jgi:AcrR family transcriptional regulator